MHSILSFRYPDHIDEFFLDVLVSTSSARAQAFPERGYILAEQYRERFKVDQDCNTDGNGRDQQYERTPEAEESSKYLSKPCASFSTKTCAGEEPGKSKNRSDDDQK